MWYTPCAKSTLLVVVRWHIMFIISSEWLICNISWKLNDRHCDLDLRNACDVSKTISLRCWLKVIVKVLKVLLLIHLFLNIHYYKLHENCHRIWTYGLWILQIIIYLHKRRDPNVIRTCLFKKCRTTYTIGRIKKKKIQLGV